MVLGGLRDLTRPLERALAAPFIWAKVSPTTITVFTLAPALIAAYFAARGDWIVAFLWGLGAALLDVVDGTVARTTGRVTQFGGLVDSTVDRIVDLLFLFGVGLGLNSRPGWWVVAACAIGALGTSYVRARAYEYIRPDPKVWNVGFERGERTLVLGLGVLGQGLAETEGVSRFLASGGLYGVNILFGALLLYAVGANLTVVARIRTVRAILQGQTPGAQGTVAPEVHTTASPGASTVVATRVSPAFIALYFLLGLVGAAIGFYVELTSDAFRQYDHAMTALIVTQALLSLVFVGIVVWIRREKHAARVVLAIVFAEVAVFTAWFLWLFLLFPLWI